MVMSRYRTAAVMCPTATRENCSPAASLCLCSLLLRGTPNHAAEFLGLGNGNLHALLQPLAK